MKFFWRLLFVIIILVVVLQLYLPSAVEKIVEDAFYEHYGLENVEVSVSSLPAVGILAGKLDRVEIEIPDIVYRDIVLSAIEVSFKGIEFDLFKAYAGELDYSLTQPGQIVFELEEESINKYLYDNSINGLQEVFVELNDGESIIKSKVVLLGLDIAFDLHGNFALLDSMPVFVPGNLVIHEKSFGQIFEDKMKANFSFQIDELSNLPYNTRLTDLEVLNDSIRMTGKIGE